MTGEWLPDGGIWIALVEIIGVNLLLSGDNAVVIALACRALPESDRKRGILFGTLAAIGLRIVLTAFAVMLLGIPWLKIAGAVLLVWVAVRIIAPTVDDHGTGPQPGNLASAIRTIMVADLVMSLDNVLAVAAAAHGNLFLLVTGLALSLPIIAFGSTLVLRVLDRFPFLATGGAALLGWIAGDLAVTDPVLAGRGEDYGYLVSLLLAALVVLLGLGLRWRRTSAAAAHALADSRHGRGGRP